MDAKKSKVFVRISACIFMILLGSCRCDELWGMVGKRGSQFVLKDRPFYVNGFNTYWLMIFAVDASTRTKVSELFLQASSIGLSVCRTWAFNDGGWRALQKSPGIYDEDVFKGLDFVIAEAKKYRIRLILPLTNNWEACGGKSQYVKWGNAAGLNVSADDDFFTDPTLRAYFRSHIKTILTRTNTYTNLTYKDDPTIFAWELINEPRCSSDPTGDKLQAWIEETAMYVKSVDQTHLLGIGSEGFYGPSSPLKLQYNPNTYAQQLGVDFLRNHKAFAIDFASVHIYSDAWISTSVSDAHLQFVKTWMQTHIEDAENSLNMPVLFSEFGISSKDTGFNETFRDAFVSTTYQILLNSTKKGGGGGGSLLWQLFPVGTEYMDDGYAVYLPKSPSVATLISLHSKRIDMFNSLCSMRCHWGCRKRRTFELLKRADM